MLFEKRKNIGYVCLVWLFFFFKKMIIISVMDKNVEKIIELYIRTQENPFRENDILPFLKINRLKIAREELRAYLCAHPLVIYNRSGYYVTRLGFFTGKIFSFKPERFEVEQGILICGHRCIPFIDPEKILVQNLSDVYPLYELFGEEYIPQLFSLDPANENQDFSVTDYELPQEMPVTVHCAKDLFKRWNFSYGDRILARVVDWNTGLVSLEHVKNMKDNIFELSKSDKLRGRWKKMVEKTLEKTLNLWGPQDSIDDQLASVYLQADSYLCVPYCASISEVLKTTNKFEIGQYGVESRIWFKGEEVPAWGEWFEKEDFCEELQAEEEILPIPEYVVKEYITDLFYMKEDSVETIIHRIIPDFETLSKADYNMLILLLEKKRASMQKDYNWFADYHIGEIRHRTLVLYSKLLRLVHDLESSDADISKFSQQYLVILSQLVVHISRLVSSFAKEDVMDEKNLNVLSASLEGMELSYEETREILSAEIAINRKDTFTLVSGSREV